MSKLVKCKTCGKEIAKGGICPNCGADNRNFFSKHKVITIIAILIVLIGIGSTTIDNNKSDNSKVKSTVSNTNETKNEKKESEKVSVLKDNYIDLYYTGFNKNDLDQNGFYFTAKNLSDKDIIIQVDGDFCIDDKMYSTLTSQEIMKGSESDFSIDIYKTGGKGLVTDLQDFKKSKIKLVILDKDMNTLEEKTIEITK